MIVTALIASLLRMIDFCGVLIFFFPGNYFPGIFPVRMGCMSSMTLRQGGMLSGITFTVLLLLLCVPYSHGLVEVVVHLVSLKVKQNRLEGA